MDGIVKAVDKAMRKLAVNMDRYCQGLKPYPTSKPKVNNKKLAIIKVGNTKMLAFVDNKTMVAYKEDKRKITNVKWPKHTFVRWCTTWDF